MRGAHLAIRCFLVAAGALLTGCPVHILGSNPRPNVDLTESRTTLRLELSDDVEDRFDLPDVVMSSVSVEGWHGTLRRAFKNGFGDFFTLVRPDARADLTLLIMEARPEMTVSGTNSMEHSMYGTRPFSGSGNVRFRARLVDRGGRVLAKSFGTVASKRTLNSVGEGTTVIESAVETMFEQIAKDCFVKRSPPPPPPDLSTTSPD